MGEHVPHEAAEVEVALIADAAGLALQVHVLEDVATDHVEIFGQCFPTDSTFQLRGGCPWKDLSAKRLSCIHFLLPSLQVTVHGTKIPTCSSLLGRVLA